MSKRTQYDDLCLIRMCCWLIRFVLSVQLRVSARAVVGRAWARGRLEWLAGCVCCCVCALTHVEVQICSLLVHVHVRDVSASHVGSFDDVECDGVDALGLVVLLVPECVEEELRLLRERLLGGGGEGLQRLGAERRGEGGGHGGCREGGQMGCEAAGHATGCSQTRKSGKHSGSADGETAET